MNQFRAIASLQAAAATTFLHDNEDGIPSGANAASSIVIENREFGHNGFGTGYTHNLYIGNVGSLVFRYNFSHDANVGHTLKSRARVNTISYNRFSSLRPGEAGSTGAVTNQVNAIDKTNYRSAAPGFVELCTRRLGVRRIAQARGQLQACGVQHQPADMRRDRHRRVRSVEVAKQERGLRTRRTRRKKWPRSWPLFIAGRGARR